MMLENIDQTLKKCFEFDLKMIFLTQLSFRGSYDVVYSYFKVQRWQKNKFLNSKESLAKNKSNCQKIYPKNNMSSIIVFKENKWPMCISQLIKKKKKTRIAFRLGLALIVQTWPSQAQSTYPLIFLFSCCFFFFRIKCFLIGIITMKF